jgi:branched-chain amino acid aminotransferase
MTFGQGKIWYDGKFVDWADATLHVMSHCVHYGTSWFEGLRVYELPSGPAIFRLKDHVDRLFDSCKIYRCEIPYSREDVARAIIDTVKANNLDSCYVRPIVFRGMGQMGVNPLKCPVHLVVAAWSWGKYLGEEAMENGVSVCVSSWRRAAPDTFPTLSKAGGNYLNSQLIKMEALLEGYDEGIALDAQGFVSEGSGENVFVIRNGVIYTPPSNSSILPGLTRHCVFMLARDMNIRVEQHEVQREALYIADEVFFTGTAAEITPVSRIDNIVIGCGKRGPITEKIQSAFFAIVEGRAPDKFGWLTPVA